MKLSVIGCGGAYIDAENNQPCYIIGCENTQVILDIGSGSLCRMVAKGIKYYKIQHVFISHLHPDHVSDLAAFIQSRLVVTNLVLGEQVTRLQIYVGEEMYENVKALLNILAGDLSDIFELVCVREGVIQVAGDFIFTIMKVQHGNIVAYASRWWTKDGKVCVYTGDSAYMDQLACFALDNDLLLCDSSKGVSKITSTVHMSVYEAGILAHESLSKHLVLLHYYPGSSENILVNAARQNYNGKISLGVNIDNLVI